MTAHRVRTLLAAAQHCLPGIALSGAVAVAAMLIERAEIHVFGRAWLEGLVVAILLGALVRNLRAPCARTEAGIGFAAKTLLEIAVVLLGLSVSAAALVAAGPLLILGTAGVVVGALALGYGIGRALGLPHKLAVLIACGNAICGNSAIAATAPVIRAQSEDVASSIAFTAVLGVAVVLAMPPFTAALGLAAHASGVFAGLTVYAVPQVVAATAPIGAIAMQTGMLVKLLRVTMLGPVVFALALSSRGAAGDLRLAPSRLVPWFVLGFLAMIAIRASGVVPPAVLPVAAAAANVLTIVSMAALGLGVDLRTVAGAGARVVTAVLLSLAALGLLSFGLVVLLGVR